MNDEWKGKKAFVEYDCWRMIAKTFLDIIQSYNDHLKPSRPKNNSVPILKWISKRKKEKKRKVIEKIGGILRNSNILCSGKGLSS